MFYTKMSYEKGPFTIFVLQTNKKQYFFSVLVTLLKCQQCELVLHYFDCSIRENKSLLSFHVLLID